VGKYGKRVKTCQGGGGERRIWSTKKQSVVNKPRGKKIKSDKVQCKRKGVGRMGHSIRKGKKKTERLTLHKKPPKMEKVARARLSKQGGADREPSTTRPAPWGKKKRWW